MNTNKTEMAKKLKRKLKADKVGYFSRDNVWLKKDKLCGKIKHVKLINVVNRV